MALDASANVAASAICPSYTERRRKGGVVCELKQKRKAIQKAADRNQPFSLPERFACPNHDNDPWCYFGFFVQYGCHFEIIETMIVIYVA